MVVSCLPHPAGAETIGLEKTSPLGAAAVDSTSDGASE